jgi:Na+-translocating ferredoxin:NAD+ oxidoreductase RnfE subunit
MTWKRRLAVIGLFVVLVCIGVGLAMMLTPDHRPGVTRANFDKLEVGMNKTQVLELLGTTSESVHGGGLGGGIWQSWVGKDGSTASISYSVRHIRRGEWRVESVCWHDSRETNWQRVRRWLRIPV